MSQLHEECTKKTGFTGFASFFLIAEADLVLRVGNIKSSTSVYFYNHPNRPSILGWSLLTKESPLIGHLFNT